MGAERTVGSVPENAAENGAESMGVVQSTMVYRVSSRKSDGRGSLEV